MILGSGLVTAVAIGLTAVLILRAHRAELVSELTRAADQLTETIKSSTRYDMLENRRESLRRQIETIGRQEGIHRVRLFNKEGRIMFSSDADEIGRSLDKGAEACYACHAVGQPLERLPIAARGRIFRGPDGDRILGIVNPIQNETACSTAACHAHPPGAAVLGVLDVTMSLSDVDREIAASQGWMAGLAALAIAASSLILWWLNRRLVVVPAQALLLATRRVAEGDLTTTIPVGARHELGEVARAFNEMTRKLADAQRQVTQAEKLASVGRLAAGVAHEINNPLTGVLTYASFLLERCDSSPELREDLEVIVRETKRCRDIVRGLLDFARQTPPRRQPTEVNEVVRRAMTVVMNQLALSRVSLDLDLSPGLPPLPADGNQLQQVVVNLLLNAADAIGERGGRIRLSSRAVALPPRGHVPIRRALCPKGCELLDPAIRIRGLPSILVTRTCRDREDPVHLDPVYGRANLAAEPCEEGVVADYACPRCRRSLGVEGRRCEVCGAPVFAVSVPGLDRVLWCARKGCHWTLWEVQDAAGERRVVEVAVEDTGRGIPPESLPHLFEPFFSTKGTRGTGLGLAVTWGIVEGHGGTIDVESEVGRGSRFTVRLPFEPATLAEPALTPARR